MKHALCIVLLIATRVYAEASTTQPAPLLQLTAGELSATFSRHPQGMP